MKWKSVWNYRGSALAEVLILLIICNFSIYTLTGILKNYQRLKQDNYRMQDLISIYQLESLLLIAENLEIQDDYMEFIIGEEYFSIELINNKIILSPGTQILFYDVTTCHFEMLNNTLLVYLLRNEKETNYYVKLFK